MFIVLVINGELFHVVTLLWGKISGGKSQDMSVYCGVGIATTIPLYYSSLRSIIHFFVHIWAPHVTLTGRTAG